MCPFPNVNAGKWQISASGGVTPVWARDGRELFYIVQSGTVLAVSVDDGESFQFGNSEVLFEHTQLLRSPGSYDVASDGRFLFIRDLESDVTRGEIVVVLDWLEELKQLVPTNN